MEPRLFQKKCTIGLCLVMLFNMTAFKSAQPSMAYTLVEGLWTGTTSWAYPMSYSVSSMQWSNFKLKTGFFAAICSTWVTFEISVPGPGTISNDKFSYSSSDYSFTGQFTSSTAANGTYSFTNYRLVFNIPYPPYVCSEFLTQSGTWNASIPPPLPGSFTKISPGNDAVGQIIPVTLTWNPSLYADSYQYCLDMDAVENTTCDTSWVDVPAGTSVSPSGLAADTTYYWQVRAHNTTGDTEADSGAWWSFRTTPPILSATFPSTGTYDGWILESSETSNQGGTLNATDTTIRLGDDVGDKQYRAILSFNTGALPDTAVITKVTLKIKRPAAGYLIGNNSPFSWGMGLKVDMRKPFFGTTLGLVLSDFQAAAGKSAAATFSATPVANWYSAVIGSAGHPYINKTGTTQFRLRFAKEDNDDGSPDYMKFYSGNYSGAASRPALVIEYYLP